MATLAQKLPYTHAFSGGAQWGGHQRLPSDPDALDYLSRLAAVEGAVEVGVAMAVENFIKGCKADGIWDAIKASCILCGARTLAGALVPLKNEGPELVDIDNLPTPTVYQLDGSSGEWNASTSTMVNTAGGNPSYPRFLFSFPGVVTGKTYAVSGRFSGDTTHVSNIRGGSSGGLASINTATGEFAATLTQGGVAGFNVLFFGTAAPTSVTIESLSIREVIAAPTNVNNNFVDADYNRETGLAGDGLTKYLDSGRANDADPQDDAHLGYYATNPGSSTRQPMTSGWNANGAREITRSSTIYYGRVNANYLDHVGAGVVANGFVGLSRSSSTTVSMCSAGTTASGLSQVSVAPNANNIWVFRGQSYTNARIAFYSIGESLGPDPATGLALLDSRVTDLVTSIGAAI